MEDKITSSAINIATYDDKHVVFAHAQPLKYVLGIIIRSILLQVLMAAPSFAHAETKDQVHQKVVSTTTPGACVAVDMGNDDVVTQQIEIPEWVRRLQPDQRHKLAFSIAKAGQVSSGAAKWIGGMTIHIFIPPEINSDTKNLVIESTNYFVRFIKRENIVRTNSLTVYGGDYFRVDVLSNRIPSDFNFERCGSIVDQAHEAYGRNPDKAGLLSEMTLHALSKGNATARVALRFYLNPMKIIRDENAVREKNLFIALLDVSLGFYGVDSFAPIDWADHREDYIKLYYKSSVVPGDSLDVATSKIESILANSP